MSSAMGEPHADDAYWRRPPEGGQPSGDGPAEPRWGGAPSGGPRIPDAQAYSGPPRTAPPPHGWRPPIVVQPHAPRALPAQDAQAVERQEQAARTVTMGVGLVAGAVLVVLMLVLCGRWLF